MHAQEFVSSAPFPSNRTDAAPSSRASSGFRQAATALASELLPPRLREFVLGGATRGILDEITVPVLMSH